MKEQDLIKSLINEGESNQLEFKEVLRIEEVAKSVCAFLNANGGIVLIGVKDNGEIVGVKDAARHETKLKSYLIEVIVPEAPITVYSEKVSNKDVIIVKVWNGSKPPYIFGGNIYFRKSNKTIKASVRDISKLILERQETEQHWERRPAIGVEIKDLDEIEIRNTLKDITQSGRGKTFKESHVEEFLSYYGLYQNGNLTNSAVVLFAKEPARYLPQCRVRLTVFKSGKSADSYVHDRILEGNLFKNISEILQFFEVNIASSSSFTEQLWHRQDMSYPKLALREGLLNALIHRDYSNVSGSAIVAFYPDFLEITNYGELPAELKPSDLTRNHLSLPRNPDIAHICFLRQMIEKIGRGTIKIIEDCEDKGYPKPKWTSRNGITTLIFPEVTITAKTSDDRVNDTVRDTVNDTVRDTVNDTVKKRLIGIIKALVSKPGMRSNELAKMFGVTEVTIRRDMQKISNLVDYEGAPKTGGYHITEYMMGKLKSK